MPPKSADRIISAAVLAPFGSGMVGRSTQSTLTMTLAIRKITVKASAETARVLLWQCGHVREKSLHNISAGHDRTK